MKHKRPAGCDGEVHDIILSSISVTRPISYDKEMILLKKQLYVTLNIFVFIRSEQLLRKSMFNLMTKIESRFEIYVL